jgi:hypothetical protein
LKQKDMTTNKIIRKPLYLNLLEAKYSLIRDDSGERRTYITPSGARLPSVTSILGWHKEPSLRAWKDRVGHEEAARIAAAAAHRGTLLHNFCEDYILGRDINEETLDPVTIQLFKSIQPYIDEFEEVNASEMQLYSEFLGVAGTTDVIGRFRNRRSIIDFKTSSKFKRKDWIDDYFMQTACYAVMYEERTGIPIKQLVIIIAVEGSNEGQLFIEERDNWIEKARKVIGEYYEHHGLTKEGYLKKDGYGKREEVSNQVQLSA